MDLQYTSLRAHPSALAKFFYLVPIEAILGEKTGIPPSVAPFHLFPPTVGSYRERTERGEYSTGPVGVVQYDVSGFYLGNRETKEAVN